MVASVKVRLTTDRVLIISVAEKIKVMFLSYMLLHFQYVTQKTLSKDLWSAGLFIPQWSTGHTLRE